MYPFLLHLASRYQHSNTSYAAVTAIKIKLFAQCARFDSQMQTNKQKKKQLSPQQKLNAKVEP